MPLSIKKYQSSLTSSSYLYQYTTESTWHNNYGHIIEFLNSSEQYFCRLKPCCCESVGICKFNLERGSFNHVFKTNIQTFTLYRIRCMHIYIHTNTFIFYKLLTLYMYNLEGESTLST